VHLEQADGGPAITRIELSTEGEVGGIDADEFQRHAESAKSGCPVSKALAGVEISLEANLLADTSEPTRRDGADG
jgi:osmotically inducible protein OsmC